MTNFSVLLSIYYKEDPSFLVQALDSVFNQTINPSEVVLVKDGPLTEELDRVIDDYLSRCNNFRVVVLPENRGLGYALNEGIKECSNEWIARMDTDDICFQDRFEKQLAVIDKNPDLSFVGSAIAEFQDSPDQICSYRRLPERNEDIYVYAKKRCPINHPSVMYRKSVILDAGGYREFPEDYHLWVRALMKGYKFYNIQEPLLYFRINLETIKRRGGMSYALAEIRHQKEFKNMGFLTTSEYLYNCIVRISVRLMPPLLRQKIYSKLLRRE